MSDDTYTIIEKKLAGLKVIGFNIINSNNIKSYITYEDCLKLVRLSKITNATLLLDILTGEYILNVENGIDNLPIAEAITKYKILGRLIKDNKCIGYNLTDKSGKTYKISIKKVWELASNGEIEGIRGIILNKHKVIKSIDNDFIKTLNKLQT